jgi:hypothetical protein
MSIGHFIQGLIVRGRFVWERIVRVPSICERCAEPLLRMQYRLIYNNLSQIEPHLRTVQYSVVSGSIVKSSYSSLRDDDYLVHYLSILLHC